MVEAAYNRHYSMWCFLQAAKCRFREVFYRWYSWVVSYSLCYYRVTQLAAIANEYDSRFQSSNSAPASYSRDNADDPSHSWIRVVASAETTFAFPERSNDENVTFDTLSLTQPLTSQRDTCLMSQIEIWNFNFVTVDSDLYSSASAIYRLSA